MNLTQDQIKRLARKTVHFAAQYRYDIFFKDDKGKISSSAQIDSSPNGFRTYRDNKFPDLNASKIRVEVRRKKLSQWGIHSAYVSGSDLLWFADFDVDQDVFKQAKPTRGRPCDLELLPWLHLSVEPKGKGFVCTEFELRMDQYAENNWQALSEIPELCWAKDMMREYPKLLCGTPYAKQLTNSEQDLVMLLTHMQRVEKESDPLGIDFD